MEAKDREYRILKLGLTLKKLMDASNSNKSGVLLDDISSFRKFETSTGVRHASLVKIVNGEKNAAWSTIGAILEGLGMSLTQFGSFYDSITSDEVKDYEIELHRKRLERENKKKVTKKKLTAKIKKAGAKNAANKD